MRRMTQVLTFLTLRQREHAIRQARVTFAETAKVAGRVVLHHRIDIEDEKGSVLGTVRFRDAVKIED